MSSGDEELMRFSGESEAGPIHRIDREVPGITVISQEQLQLSGRKFSSCCGCKDFLKCREMEGGWRCN